MRVTLYSSSFHIMWFLRMHVTPIVVGIHNDHAKNQTPNTKPSNATITSSIRSLEMHCIAYHTRCSLYTDCCLGEYFYSFTSYCTYALTRSRKRDREPEGKVGKMKWVFIAGRQLLPYIPDCLLVASLLPYPRKTQRNLVYAHKYKLHLSDCSRWKENNTIFENGKIIASQISKNFF